MVTQRDIDSTPAWFTKAYPFYFTFFFLHWFFISCGVRVSMSEMDVTHRNDGRCGRRIASRLFNSIQYHSKSLWFLRRYLFIYLSICLLIWWNGGNVKEMQHDATITTARWWLFGIWLSNWFGCSSANWIRLAGTRSNKSLLRRILIGGGLSSIGGCRRGEGAWKPAGCNGHQIWGPGKSGDQFWLIKAVVLNATCRSSWNLHTVPRPTASHQWAWWRR